VNEKHGESYNQFVFVFLVTLFTALRIVDLRQKKEQQQRVQRELQQLVLVLEQLEQELLQQKMPTQQAT
jgi:hypothetical protein